MSIVMTGPGGGSSQILPGNMTLDEVRPAPVAGAFADWAPENRIGASAIGISMLADATCSGIAGGTRSQILLISNRSSTFTLTCTANDGASLAANQFASAFTLPPGTGTFLIYSGLLAKWIPLIGTASGGGGGGSGSFNFTSFESWSGAAVNTPAALAVGATADYNPAALATARLLRLTPNAAGSSLSGIAIQAGHILTLRNLAAVGGATITLLNLNAGSAVGNRFTLPGDFVLVPQASVTLYGGAAGWELIA